MKFPKYFDLWKWESDTILGTVGLMVIKRRGDHVLCARHRDYSWADASEAGPHR